MYESLTQFDSPRCPTCLQTFSIMFRFARYRYEITADI